MNTAKLKMLAFAATMLVWSKIVAGYRWVSGKVWG